MQSLEVLEAFLQGDLGRGFGAAPGVHQRRHLQSVWPGKADDFVDADPSGRVHFCCSLLCYRIDSNIDRAVPVSLPGIVDFLSYLQFHATMCYRGLHEPARVVESCFLFSPALVNVTKFPIQFPHREKSGFVFVDKLLSSSQKQECHAAKIK